MKGSRVSKLFPQVGISEKRRFYRYHEPSLNRLIRNPKNFLFLRAFRFRFLLLWCYRFWKKERKKRKKIDSNERKFKNVGKIRGCQRLVISIPREAENVDKFTFAALENWSGSQRAKDKSNKPLRGLCTRSVPFRRSLEMTWRSLAIQEDLSSPATNGTWKESPGLMKW